FLRKKLNITKEDAKRVIRFITLYVNDEENREPLINETYDKPVDEVAIRRWAEQAQAEEWLSRLYANIDLNQGTVLSNDENNSVVLGRFGDGTPKSLLTWDTTTGELIVKKYKRENGGYYEIWRDVIPFVNLKNIAVYSDGDTTYIQDLRLGKLMQLDEYIRALALDTQDGNRLRWAISLPAVKRITKPYGLELVEIDGKINLPPIDLIYTNNWYAERLKNSLILSKDREKLECLSEQLWAMASPKQRADVAAIIGATLFNAINSIRNLGLRDVMVHLAGKTLSGKTWIVRNAIKLYFGLDLSKEKQNLLGPDALETPFRFESVVSSTNLPILIDEAAAVSDKLLSLLKSKTTGAIGIRGRADLTVTDYALSATIVSTSQSNIYLGIGSLSDNMAIANRVYVNNYQEGDADRSKAVEYDLFASALKEGGLVYLWLSGYSAEQLEKAVLDAYKLANGNSILAALLLGLAFLGKLTVEDVTQIEVDNLGGDDPLVEAVQILYNDYDQINAGKWGNVELGTMLDKDDDWLYISSMYLQHINKDIRHPLQGRFRNLGAFKELADVFNISPSEIYDKTARHRFGSTVSTFAKIPLEIPKDNKCNGSVTKSVTNILYNLQREEDNNVTLLHLLHTNSVLYKNVHLNNCSKNENYKNYIKVYKNGVNGVTSVTIDDKTRYTACYTLEPKIESVTENQSNSNTLLDNSSASGSTSPLTAPDPSPEAGASAPASPASGDPQLEAQDKARAKRQALAQAIYKAIERSNE
ncbi:MAG: hypothetical protein ACP5MB_10785, partial [bacterium]